MTTTRPPRRFPWCLAWILSALFAGNAALAGDGATGKPPEKIKLYFHWKNQAQWAGFYMAKEKGIYLKYGLDVDLNPRPGRSDPLDLLLDGRTDFATHFLTSGLGVRGHRQPVVLVGQLFNRSHLMMVARRSDGIEKIADFSGRTVAFWDGYYRFIFRALLKRYGAVDVIERPMGLNVHQFTSRQVDACSAMEYNEYNLIRSAMGDAVADLIVFRLRDMGLDFPEDALYVTEDYARRRPEICRAMLAATLEGWAYAKENPEETLDVVMRRIAVNPSERLSREHMRWMLDICAAGVVPPEDSPRRTGQLSRRDFNLVKDFLKDNAQIRHDFSYEDFVVLDAVESP